MITEQRGFIAFFFFGFNRGNLAKDGKTKSWLSFQMDYSPLFDENPLQIIGSFTLIDWGGVWEETHMPWAGS